MLNPNRTAVLFIICLVHVLNTSSTAQLPRVRLNSVFPPGGQAGTKLDLTIGGELSDSASELVFSHPDIEAIQQREPESEFRVPHRRPGKFDVVIGEHVSPGRYEVRALGPAGLSAARSFVVSHLDNKLFDGNGNAKDKPFTVQVGEAVNVQARPNTRDYFRVNAQQFRPLSIQVLAQRIDSKMDPILALYDSNGRRISKVKQSLTRDPILCFSPPADGEYLVEISDSTYQGGAQYVYRLEVTEQPLVEAIHPVVWQPDVKGEFTVYGYNLPGGVPVSGMEQAGLQSSKLTLTPDLTGEKSSAVARGGWQNSVALARTDGRHIELPEAFLGAPPVFLSRAEHPVQLETDADTTAETAQAVSLPAAIAGQFFPRRDRDHFEFAAKKGQTLWIELTAQQFGANSDPIIRIQRKHNDGKLENVTASDDIEGPANSRDNRRLYSGTQDVSFPFKVANDGNYVVSVTDQYNVSVDDPRLCYRLTIQPAKPDFRLIAFADPERHGDEKIAKPNGLAIAPGGSTTLRVRTLSRHGFNEPIKVAVHGLPEGVTASPILLSGSRKEGLLVIQATEQAKPELAMVQVVGESMDGTIAHQATVASIIQGANNTDAQATVSRQSLDFPLAILDVKASPVRMTVNQPVLKTARGISKLAVPVSLFRRDDFKDFEITASAIQAPNGLKVEASKSKSDKLEIFLTTTDPKLKPGQHTLVLGTKVKDKRPRNPFKVEEAKRDLGKIAKTIEVVSETLKQEEQNAASQKQVIESAKRAIAAIQAEAQGPRAELSKNLQQQLAAAVSLADQTQLAIEGVSATTPSSPKEVQQLVAQQESSQKTLAATTEKLAMLRDRNGILQEQLGSIIQKLAASQSQMASLTAAATKAANALKAAEENRDVALKQKAETEKRLQEAEKNELQKEAEFWVYSNAVTVDIANSPVEVTAGKRHQVSPDSSGDISVFVERKFSFNGQVTFELVLPPQAKLVATTLVVGPGIESGMLTVSAAKDAPVGAWQAKLKAKLRQGGLEIVDESFVTINVVLPKP